MTAPVTIIGAGWAGLAAAVTLAGQGIAVQVYESAKQIGGRARSVDSHGREVDNGQHLMIGAYSELLRLLRHMNVRENELFLRTPQTLHMLDAGTGASLFRLGLPRLPAPLHLLAGLLRCRGLGWRQRVITLLRFNRLLKTPLQQDCSVSHWLAGANLPDSYVRHVLEPLCLAALTTHPREASARAFRNVLIETFHGPRAHTDLLIPRKNLGEVFPERARDYIESHGGRVFTGTRVKRLQANGGRVTSMVVDDTEIPVERIILATPASVTAQLLQNVEACRPVCEQLAQLAFEPVTTVYLQYAPSTRLTLPMLGLLNGTAEWLFDRRVCDQPGLIAAVISAGGEHQALDHTQLIERVSAELGELFDWPRPEQAWVIREKRACVRCSPDIDKIRPVAQTPLANLLLCGDYVYTEDNNQPGLPSTLEGALRSGVKCAQTLIKDMN